MEKEILKVLSICGSGDHLGHVSWTVLYQCLFLLPMEAQNEI